MNYIILNNTKDEKKVINYLIKIYGLPKIQRRLNIFSEDDVYRIEIVNNKVIYRVNNRSKYIIVENKNLKHFFKMMDSNNYFISDITILDFKECSMMFDTYHGTLIATQNITVCDDLKNNFNVIFYENILEHKMKKKPVAEKLFDEVGNLNIKIKNYAKKVGLDIRSVSTSLKIRNSNVSNDYTYLEDTYHFITNDKLLTLNETIKRKYKVSNISIIIPVFNQDVTYTLLSIQGQKLSLEEKKGLQVIIINDGSENDVLKEIDKIKDKLDFELQIVSFDQNMGLSNARNVGTALAKYEHILFIDSDIILSKNYIYDMSIRLQLIPNAVFICMRKNISKTSKILDQNYLLKGVESCYDFDDSRVITKGKKYHVGCDSSYLNEEINILDDTDYFKDLGYGSQIEIYNIATVVTGHNIAINNSYVNMSKPFSTKFKGWGMEDSYFAAKLVAEGCFVIPVLSSCVYHIDHPCRSGSIEQKQKEAQLNFQIYNELLEQTWK